MRLNDYQDGGRPPACTLIISNLGLCHRTSIFYAIQLPYAKFH